MITAISHRDEIPFPVELLAHEIRYGYIVDKVEGFAIDAAGNGFVVTDNDGVVDLSGETYFFTTGGM